MPETIQIAHTQKFHDDFILLAQQKDSRLQRTVREDPDHLDGKAGYFDRLGAVEMQEILDRNADTPNNDIPHSRRRIVLRDFNFGRIIDKVDVRRMKHGGMLPDKYRQLGVMAANRKKDDLIIAAANGNAYNMDEDLGASAIALPTAQKIAVGGAGLTLAKVLQAKEIKDGAEVDEEEPRYAVVTSKQITNMLNTTEVKSADFNSVKALVEGKLNEFLGYTWIRSERLTLDGSGDRLCLFYAHSALGLAVGEDIMIDIGVRRDKNVNTQVYIEMSMDATRIEDEKLVQIACQET